MPGGPESFHLKLLARDQVQHFSCPQDSQSGHKCREAFAATHPICGSIVAPEWVPVAVIPAPLP